MTEPPRQFADLRRAVLARIEEIEATARAAIAAFHGPPAPTGRWAATGQELDPEAGYVRDADTGQAVALYAGYDDPVGLLREVAVHIAAHDPDAVLRWAASLRRIAEIGSSDEVGRSWQAFEDGYMSGFADAHRLAVYAVAEAVGVDTAPWLVAPGGGNT